MKHRPAAAFALVPLILGGLAACGGENRPESLPSTRPTVEFSAERTTRSTPTEEKTTEATDPTPTRTRPTADQPTREPTAEPTRAPTTQEATKEPTPAATSTSAAVAPVADQDDGGLGPWAWLLLIGLLTGLVGLLLVNRDRRVATWDAEARGLAGETRAVLGVRLPQLLTDLDPARRGSAWPPVRDDLTALEARWTALLERVPDGERQAYAGQVAGMLRDLVNAVDAENAALATGRDWRMLRPRVDAVIAALSAALDPGPAAPAAAAAAPAAPSPAPEPATRETSIYGEPLDEDPGDYPPPPPRAPRPGYRPPASTD
ncbi:C-jun-amino-terminal kinase-interacting protein 3 [Actinoplanes sp. SE50]|uniref:hypothetical protein n=1 Tax=unclassified Actinoplanes TaxID=2626549 RepID=UPI00023ED096|nr:MULTISPECIES: hypothetical protein [unclassified Actinoplanes]AEV84920.1 C-jun-amino-terminal kinase-interacting protein 3 [Actinoplanes sp. SE50/110]ATO83311.1 C-jun-amino-terminal kinase-interacting protein 3 [Actinoplanes sp. SE50]SLM00718.1 uncharacterized protein ACSP50_3951 [Actinoplanes sp. SE50/110]